MDITITILRDDVMSIVEGLSATIAQHNSGVPTMEQLWASESEKRKLDIWWRSSVTDLEEAYKHWIVESTPMFDMTVECDDYTITFAVSYHWSQRLTGLLANHIQNYFVFSILAGWLGDLANITAPDYAVLAANELKKSIGILSMRELDADGVAAGIDDITKDFSEEGGGGVAGRDRDDLKPYRPAKEYVVEAKGGMFKI